jgi:hypothetical protein
MPHLVADGHRRSISTKISSAHLIESAMALTVAGTLFPPSYCCQLPRRQNQRSDQQHALSTFVHANNLAHSPFIRLHGMLF